MELSKLLPGERMLEILTPGKKEPIGIRVTIVFVNDDSMKKIKRQIQDEKQRLEARGKYFKSESLETNAAELCFNAMTGWEWYNPTGEKGKKGYDEKAQTLWHGEIPVFNKKNVMAVFEKLEWFRDQILEEIGNAEAFFPN